VTKELDLSRALNQALLAATEGRKVLLHYFGQLKKVQEKASAGLVSEADIESEKVISKILKEGFPEIPVLGEEGAFASHDERVRDTMWVVDPLDGTTNYVHGLSAFCISIGLQWQGRVVAGVVDVPLMNKTYSAAEGLGAFANGERLHVSQRVGIKNSLLATGFVSENPASLGEQLKIFSDLVFEARGIRRLGAAAYDLALTAEGVFDAFWEPNLKPWDAAAGIILVREAGGVVWTYQERDYKLGDTRILAGNRGVCEEVGRRISTVI
jgi:myo-inositol-1(or 4)-monophosphatase